MPRGARHDASEEDAEGGYAGVTTGTSVVLSEQGPLTPPMPLTYAWVYDPDRDSTETHHGWILLGDFIFLATPEGVHLWADGPEGALDSALRLCAVVKESDDRSDRLRGVRFNDDTPLRDGWWANRMKPARAEAVDGAARVYAADHGGWRWLFPHPDGPRAAWKQMTQTSSSDDAAVMAQLLASPSDDDLMLAEAHFGPAWSVQLKRPPASRLHPILTVVPSAEALPTCWIGFGHSRALDGQHRRVSVAEALSGPTPAFGYAVSVRADVADLRGLETLPHVVSLDLRFRERMCDISAVAALRDLRELRIYGGADELVDLSPIAGLENLEFLELYNLPRVKALPDFSRLARLHTLQLGLLDHVVDLDIGELKALRDLAIYACQKLRGRDVIERLQRQHALTKVRVISCPEIGDVVVEA